jgi:hypothetical protein
VGNIAGAQSAIKDAGNLFKGATVQRFAQGAKALASLAFLQNIGHGSPQSENAGIIAKLGCTGEKEL